MSNVNNLTNKVPYVQNFVTDNNVHILGITETWLTNSIFDSTVSISNYNLFRNDISGDVHKHGVCLYIHNSITCLHVDNVVPNVCSVYLSEYNVYILVIYRPPSYNFLDNITMINFLQNFCYGKEAIVIGDFNLPSLTWLSGSTSHSYSSSTNSLFLDCFTSLGLTQWTEEPTNIRANNILDLVLTSETDRVLSTNVLPPFPNCDHCVILCSYVFQFKCHPTPDCSTSYFWPKANFKKINETLSTIDWDFEFSDLTINDAYSRFLSIISSLGKSYAPSCRPNTNSISNKPWEHKPPKELSTSRRQAWKYYKELRTLHGRNSQMATDALQAFLEINFNYRNYTTHRQIAYENQILSNFSTNPKPFHSYIRSRKVGCPSVGPLSSPDGFTSNPKEMASILGSAFASVFTTPSGLPQSPHQSHEGTFQEIHLSMSDVTKALSSINPTSAMGPDSIHPALLSKCSSTLAYPLYLLFTMSVQSGRIPIAWQNSHVVPIFKKAKKCNPLNYRQISLTSTPCKTLERIITTKLYQYLESNSILSPNQFGFRSGRSVEDQLLLTYNDVTYWMDNGNMIDLIFFDFAKAFGHGEPSNTFYQTSVHWC